jgi:hypothetical protein
MVLTRAPGAAVSGGMFGAFLLSGSTKGKFFTTDKRHHTAFIKKGLSYGRG